MLAPMEDYTDSAFRRLCFNHGVDLTFSEMMWVEGILRSNNPTLIKYSFFDNTPVQIQLLVNNSEQVKKFLKNFIPFDGFEGFNLNYGCPSRKVIKAGRGPAMVRRVSRTKEIIKVFRDANYKISIKMRLGLNELDLENKSYLNLIRETDPDFFVVHGKHAMQRSGESIDNSIYEECISESKGIPIIANGNIYTKKNVEDLKRIGLSGVMLGRGAIKNPAIFDLIKGNNIPSSEKIREEYLELAKKYQTHPKYIEKVLAGIKFRE